jgi:hypothetical protein
MENIVTLKESAETFYKAEKGESRRKIIVQI